MSFSDHKITQFTHKITDLPDQPSLPANELKARFDSSPEELRQAVNGICDEASRLEARVEGIVVDTFGDTITEEMLSDDLDANLMRRSDLYFGTYTGDGVFPREIELGFAPRVLYVMRADGYIGSSGNIYQLLTIADQPPVENAHVLLTPTGFCLSNEDGHCMLNSTDKLFVYFAL